MTRVIPQNGSGPASIVRRLTDSIRQAVVIEPAKLKLIVAALVARGHVLLVSSQ